MRVGSHILGYVALGLIINLIFLIALTPDITGMLKAEVISTGKEVVSTGKDAVSSGKDAIGSAIPRGITDVARDPVKWVVTKLIPLALFALLAVGFLIAYFLLGKRAGVTSALNYVVDANKRYLIDRVLGGFASYLSSEISRSQSNSLTQFQDEFESYKRKLNNQPLVLRWMCQAFLRKFSLDSTIVEAFESGGAEDLSSQDYWQKFTARVGDKLDVDVFPASYVPLAILVVANLAVGFALKLYF